MGTPEQFDLFDEEPGDDTEQEEGNHENPEVDMADERTKSADESFGSAVENAKAERKKDLMNEMYPGAKKKEVGPGRKAWLEKVKELKNRKDE